MRTLKKIITVLVAVAALGGLGLAVSIGSLSLRRNLAAREYKAEGFQMVHGCNGGAAGEADGQVYTIKQHLEEFAGSPNSDTNIIIQLQSALVLAQDKARILSEDCRRRGHCETHPWKTNWVTINQALSAAEKLYQ